MIAQSFSRLGAWLRRIEAKADAWAGARLTPEEYAEAKALDVRLKRNFWRWLGIYLAVVGAAGAILGVLAPKLGWGRAFFVANMVGIAVLMLFLAAWFRYTKFIGPRALKTFALFTALLFAGGLTGAFVGSLGSGKPLAELPPEKILRMVAAIAGIGAVLMGFIAGIAYLRSREARQKLSLLESEAAGERLARQGMQAELKLLQAQVEPHFLFNTLANLRFLVQTDPPQALAMLDHLIHYLRTALPEIRAESSTLGREIELAHAYLEIMRIRMDGALEISATAPPELAGMPFPPLVLLTLVENAIKHGIAPVGKGHVRVSAAAAGERVRLMVEDDGRGLIEPIGPGVGLANVRERLRAIFGESARLELAARAGGGTVAAIEIPR
jgi:signal transduction histidine kinase